MRIFAALFVVLLASCAPTIEPSALAAGGPDFRSFVPRGATAPVRSNAEIARDFLDLSFQMESGRQLPVLTRFEEPVRVRTLGAIPPTLPADLAALLGRLRREAQIDIRETGSSDAQITIETVPSERLHAAVPGAACFVVPRISSWTEFAAMRDTGQVDWTTLTRRERAAIFVPADAAPQEIRDCLHEELAQALGPLNDLYRLPDSVFNDDNIHAVLTGFDMLILRAYYADELSNGMTRDEVAQVIPSVLARLNPRGAGGGQTYETAEDPAWAQSIQTALANDQPVSRRQAAAADAVRTAQMGGWGGAREGFAHYAFGRLLVSSDPVAARDAFRAAARTYSGSSTLRIHEAHVAVQLAAFALRAGDGAEALAVIGPAIPVAEAHENAALLATLLMLKAEALDLVGRGEEAQVVRLDSASWARYGFGSDAKIAARQREIAGLRPGIRG